MPRKHRLTDHESGDVFQDTWSQALATDEVPYEDEFAAWLTSLALAKTRRVRRRRREPRLDPEAAERIA